MLIRFNKRTIVFDTIYNAGQEATIDDDIAQSIIAEGNAEYVRMETRTIDAHYAFDANGNVTGLLGPNGESYAAFKSVPAATGDATTDTANINATITAAGNGGIVIFPENQEYAITNYVGSPTVVPSKIIGNGSTLKAANQPYTNLATGQSITTGGSQTFTVADGTQLAGALFIVAATGTGSYSSPMAVTSIVGDSVTVSSATVTGTLSGTGVTVTPVINLVLIQITDSATQQSFEMTGLTLDGNAANRTRNRQWSNDELLKIVNTVGETPKLWIHHNVFKNAPTEGVSAADCTYLDISHNHFENIVGSGIHPGGAVVDSSNVFICAGNTFKNVYQLTSATTPTLQAYGHTTSFGAMCTSNGPARGVWANNVVDTSTGYGVFAATNVYTHDYAITGNVFYNCAMGGFRCNSVGEKVTITGNTLVNCGHDTLDTATLTVETTAMSGTAKKTVISGNTFIDSQLWLGIDAGDMVVSGNYFSALAKQKGTRELASISLAYSSSENATIAIVGNVLRGPKNSTESTAISNNPWDGISFSRANGVTVSGNAITGYRHGINFNSSIYNGVSLSNNVFFDQFNSGGANSHCINAGTATTVRGMSIVGNTMHLSASGTASWTGIEFGTVTTCINNLISGNIITAPTVNTGNAGIQMNGNTGGWAITNNSIYLGYGASAIGAIVAASATSSTVITNNIIRNGSPVNYGAATTSSGNVSV